MKITLEFDDGLMREYKTAKPVEAGDYVTIKTTHPDTAEHCIINIEKKQ